MGLHMRERESIRYDVLLSIKNSVAVFKTQTHLLRTASVAWRTARGGGSLLLLWVRVPVKIKQFFFYSSICFLLFKENRGKERKERQLGKSDRSERRYRCVVVPHDSFSVNYA